MRPQFFRLAAVLFNMRSCL